MTVSSAKVLTFSLGLFLSAATLPAVACNQCLPAKQSFAVKNYKEAALKFKAVVKANPSCVDARLGEAEALDLVEMRRRLPGGIARDGLRRHAPVLDVLELVHHGDHFTGMDLHRALRGAELPGATRVGIELHRDRAAAVHLRVDRIADLDAGGVAFAHCRCGQSYPFQHRQISNGRRAAV